MGHRENEAAEGVGGSHSGLGEPTKARRQHVSEAACLDSPRIHVPPGVQLPHPDRHLTARVRSQATGHCSLETIFGPPQSPLPGRVARQTPDPAI